MDQAEREQIRELLIQGLSSEEVARRLGISKMSVAAVKAHMTRDASPGPDLDGEKADLVHLKFGLERDMQLALRGDIHQLNRALRIVDEGKERVVAAGRIDILAEDDQGFVVIELKAGEAPETIITQILSYIESLKRETGRPARGIVIAREFSTRVRLASAAAGLQLLTYEHRFTFKGDGA